MFGFFARKVAQETVRTVSATGIGLGIYHTGRHFQSKITRQAKNSIPELSEKALSQPKHEPPQLT